jgi:hypothetical protein
VAVAAPNQRCVRLPVPVGVTKRLGNLQGVRGAAIISDANVFRRSWKVTPL